MQVIDNVTGLLEVVAGSAEVAQKARSLVELQLEEPTAGKVYRCVCLIISRQMHTIVLQTNLASS